MKVITVSHFYGDSTIQKLKDMGLTATGIATIPLTHMKVEYGSIDCPEVLMIPVGTRI